MSRDATHGGLSAKGPAASAASSTTSDPHSLSVAPLESLSKDDLIKLIRSLTLSSGAPKTGHAIPETAAAAAAGGAPTFVTTASSSSSSAVSSTSAPHRGRHGPARNDDASALAASMDAAGTAAPGAEEDLEVDEEDLDLEGNGAADRVIQPADEHGGVFPPDFYAVHKTIEPRRGVWTDGPLPSFIQLDGFCLVPEELVAIGYNPSIRVELPEAAWARVHRSRRIVDNILARKEVVYGINTGFGNFANVVISEDQLKQLQVNLVRSHAAGVGRPLPVASARMLLALRINVLAKGHSGIRAESVRTMLDCLNKNCISYIPSQGTVGASGDLAPLSHLALGMMGEGRMWHPGRKEYLPAREVLADHGIAPLELHAKEGLALINGTQMITCIGAEAVVRAKRLARQADIIGALTIEALRGTSTAFHPYIHQARPHHGQGLVAGRVRQVLGWGTTRSEIMESHRNCNKVQDSYTLRCLPQIHGIAHETVQFVYKILLTEMNSATDNPMVFPHATRADIHVWTAAKAQESALVEYHARRIKRQLLHGHKPAQEEVESASTASPVLQAHASAHVTDHPPPLSLAPAAQAQAQAQAQGQAHAHVHAHPAASPAATEAGRGVSPAAGSPLSVASAPAHALTPLTLAGPGTARLDHFLSPSVSPEPLFPASSSASSSSSSSAAAGSSHAAADPVVRPPSGSPHPVTETSASGSAVAVRLCSSHAEITPHVCGEQDPFPCSQSHGPTHGLAHCPSTHGHDAPAAPAPSRSPAPSEGSTAGAPSLATTSSLGLAPGMTDYTHKEGVILSGGNFHGEYPAKALDYLAIGVHELANVSERRIERLVNPSLSGLPAFLVQHGGLNSGFMIAHCTAAALVSENKTLCHPASVDSLSTSAAQEDHVSMGGFAARKSLEVVKHVEMCLAIELLCACQALEFHRPLRTTEPLERVYAAVRAAVPAWTQDRYMAPDIEKVHELLCEEKVWDAVKDYLDPKFHHFIPR